IYGVNAPAATPVFRVANWLGGDGNWSTAAKWDIGAVPAADDSVRIEAPGTYTVVLAVNRTVDDLRVGGASGTQTLEVAFGRDLTLNGLLAVASNTGALRVNGTVQGPGQFII